MCNVGHEGRVVNDATSGDVDSLTAKRWSAAPRITPEDLNHPQIFADSRRFAFQSAVICVNLRTSCSQPMTADRVALPYNHLRQFASRASAWEGDVMCGPTRIFRGYRSVIVSALAMILLAAVESFAEEKSPPRIDPYG